MNKRKEPIHIFPRKPVVSIPLELSANLSEADSGFWLLAKQSPIRIIFLPACSTAVFALPCFALNCERTKKEIPAPKKIGFTHLYSLRTILARKKLGLCFLNYFLTLTVFTVSILRSFGLRFRSYMS